MPRNSSGNYTLPAGNPVVPDTLIEAEWANPTLSDIASAISDSLDRYGRGGMLAPFKVADGTVTAPGLSFTGQSNLGLYRVATDVLGIASGGASVAHFSVGGILLLKGTGIIGDTNISGALAVTGGTTVGGDLDVTGTVSAPVAELGSLSLTNPVIAAGAYLGRTVPVGGIIKWSGSVANIPVGWHLCDGTAGTPDLRDKFVIGASSDAGGPATTNVTGGASKTGGNKDAFNVAHNHTVNVGGNTGGQSANHSHFVNDPSHAHNWGHNTQGGQVGAGNFGGQGGAYAEATSGSVTGIWLNQADTDHSHGWGGTFGTTVEGSSGSNANLPPYYALAYIMCMG
jgi:hypothetical protein